MTSDLITVQQAAVILGVTKSRVYQLIAAKALTYEVEGKTKLLQKSKVEARAKKLVEQKEGGEEIAEDDRLSVAEAAELTGLTKNRIYQLIGEEKLKVVVRDGIQWVSRNQAEAHSQSVAKRKGHRVPSIEPLRAFDTLVADFFAVKASDPVIRKITVSVVDKEHRAVITYVGGATLTLILAGSRINSEVEG